MLDNEAVGKRLRELRKKAHLTQPKLYNILQEIDDNKVEVNGKQSISKLEHGTMGLSIRNAEAYAKYFNVSLDYLYFGNQHYKPEYADMKNLLGFSDDAFHQLEYLNKNNNDTINILSKLLSPDVSPFFIDLLNALSEHSLIKIKSLVSLYPGHTFLDNCDIKGYYKKPIMLKPEDLEYVSLFKISELSKNLANAIKNNGGKK